MRILRALLKPLSFLPALCLMYMIFSFSAQDGATSSQLSYKVSYTIVETGGKILGENWEPWQIDSIATRFHGASEAGTYDGILCTGCIGCLSALCIWIARHLADAGSRIYLRRLFLR